MHALGPVAALPLCTPRWTRISVNADDGLNAHCTLARARTTRYMQYRARNRVLKGQKGLEASLRA